MFLISGIAIEGIAVNGVGNFLSKILEVQFRITSSKSSIMAGILAVGGAALGTLTGGITMRFIGNNIKRKILLLIVVSFLACCSFGAFFIGCEKRDVKGVFINQNFLYCFYYFIKLTKG